MLLLVYVFLVFLCLLPELNFFFSLSGGGGGRGGGGKGERTLLEVYPFNK